MLERITREELLRNWKGPRILYKYRPFECEYHFDSLRKREVFFSTFQGNRGDDPSESKDPYSFILPSFGELVSMFRMKLKQKSAGMSNKEITQMAEQLAFRSPLWLKPEEEVQKLNQGHEDSIKEWGIFCSTFNSNSDFCWRKFAKDYTGFVIGYNIEAFLFDSSISMSPVDYFENERPKISWKTLFEFTEGFANSKEATYRMLELKYCKKPTSFALEEEWRILMNGIQSFSERKWVVQERHIDCVLIGRNMSQEKINQLRKFAAEGGIDPNKISIADTIPRS